MTAHNCDNMLAKLAVAGPFVDSDCKDPQSHSASTSSSLAGDLGFDFEALDLQDETAVPELRLPMMTDPEMGHNFEALPQLDRLSPGIGGPLKSTKSVGFELAVPLPESPLRSRSVPNHWRIRAQLEPPTPLRRCRSAHAGGLGFCPGSLSSIATSPHSDGFTEDLEILPTERGLRVGVVVSGSRGDVQPHVALALDLRSLGHQVRIFTNSNHAALCARHGVEMVSVFADSQACIEQIGGVSGETLLASLKSVSRAQRAAKVWFEDHPGKCTALEDALEDFAPEALLTSNEACAAAVRYEKLTGTPTIFACFFRAMMEFQSSMLQMQPPRPAFLAASGLLDEEASLTEADSCLVQTGPWFLEDQPTQKELAEGDLARLRSFLDAGSAPVAVCWGSMIPEGMEPQSMLRLALEALRLMRRRGVVVGGYARLDELGDRLLNGDLVDEGWSDLAEFARSSVCFVADVPHTWLLPHCSCLVHHGGAGTVQTAMRAEVPSVVTPVFVDQFDNARAVSRLRAGVGFEEPLSKVSASQLAEAIAAAELQQPEVERLGERLRSSGGSKEAAAQLDAFLREEVSEGHFARQ
ncbi:UGT80B1, partial [Symbiodinium sp. CCMP2456]